MPRQTPAAQILDAPDATVLDVLDRLLERGVMANGDVMLGVAGVDLIYVRLSALLCSADRVLPPISSGRKRHALRRERRGRAKRRA